MKFQVGNPLKMNEQLPSRLIFSLLNLMRFYFKFKIVYFKFNIYLTFKNNKPYKIIISIVLSKIK